MNVIRSKYAHLHRSTSSQCRSFDGSSTNDSSRGEKAYLKNKDAVGHPLRIEGCFPHQFSYSE